MASGRRHEAINLAVHGAAVAGWYWARANGHGEALDSVAPLPARVAFLFSYAVGTFLVTPDLDLAKRSVRAKSNWGVLGWLWYPYGAIFRHRGISHSWVVGPLTRLLYLIILALALSELVRVAGGALGFALMLRAELFGNWAWLLIGFAAGYFISQWLHLLADGLPGRKTRGTSRRRVR